MAKYLKKPKKNIAMNIAMVLFCLTVASTYLVSGLFARYTSSATGSASARVMKFGNLTLTETGDFLLDEHGNQTNEMMIIPGIPIQKQAFVSYSGSEAATFVFVEVTPSAHWERQEHSFYKGTYMAWSVNANWQYLTQTGNTSVFYQILEPNKTLTDEPVIYNGVINCNSDLGKNIMSSIQQVNGEDVDISITFRASVVQANGFDSVVDAWQSLSAKEGAA